MNVKEESGGPDEPVANRKLARGPTDVGIQEKRHF